MPSGYPNQTPMTKVAFATHSIAEEIVVDGKMFQAYSIAKSRNNL